MGEWDDPSLMTADRLVDAPVGWVMSGWNDPSLMTGVQKSFVFHTWVTSFGQRGRTRAQRFLTEGSETTPPAAELTDLWLCGRASILSCVCVCVDDAIIEGSPCCSVMA